MYIQVTGADQKNANRIQKSKKKKKNQWVELHLSKERKLVKMVYYQSDPEGGIIFQ